MTNNEQRDGANSSFVYIFTPDHQGNWRIREGLLIEGDEKSEVALVAHFSDWDTLKHTAAEHFEGLTEAHLWVFQHEFDELRKRIEADFERWGFWREAHEDAQRLASASIAPERDHYKEMCGTLLEACKKANTCASLPDYVREVIRDAIAKANA